MLDSGLCAAEEYARGCCAERSGSCIVAIIVQMLILTLIVPGGGADGVYILISLRLCSELISIATVMKLYANVAVINASMGIL